MSQSSPRRVEIAAPAKLNLGLEVLGKRDDGFHELATIYLAVDLWDQLTITLDGDASVPSPCGGQALPLSPTAVGERGRGMTAALTCSDPSLVTNDNLVLRALETLREQTGIAGGAHVHLEKRIPPASGLGGASSDAAAALLSARQLWNLDLPVECLVEIALEVGSDVPFFVRGGCALGRGRGEMLGPLPVPEGLWFVVVLPDVAVPNKTARLYEMLSPDDFSDGSRVIAQADRLRAGLPLDPSLLGNAFGRPLLALVPELADMSMLLRSAGASTVAISGAGPAHFVPVFDIGEAKRIAQNARNLLGRRARIEIVAPVAPRT